MTEKENQLIISHFERLRIKENAEDDILFQAIRSRFEDLLQQDITSLPKSIKELCSILGCRREYLKKHFPDLIQVFLDKKRDSKADIRKKMKATLDSENGILLSSEELATNSGCTRRQGYKQYSDLFEIRRRKEKQQIKQMLEAFISDDAKPISLAEVCRKLSHSAAYFHRNFPDLTRIIVSRSQEARSKTKLNSLSKTNQQSFSHEEIYEELSKIVNSEEPLPSLAKIIRTFGYSEIYLKKNFPQEIQIIVNRNKLDHKAIQIALEKILSRNDCSLPSLEKAAEELDLKPSDLIRGAPELAKAFPLAFLLRKQELEKELEKLLRDNPQFRSINQAANHLGCSRVYIKTNFPTLCEVILNRAKTFKEEKKAKVETLLKNALDNAQDQILSIKEIAQQISCKSLSLKNNFPELSTLILATRKNRKEIISKRFEILLAGEDYQPLPLNQLCKRFGCSYPALKKYCPEFSQIALSRYKDYIKNRPKEQEAFLRGMIAGEIPLLSIEETTLKLGCSIYYLKREFPDLYKTIVNANKLLNQ